MGSIRVLLADDHAVVREGLKSNLSDCADIDVVGQAGSGEEALRLCDVLSPDVLVIDYSMPDLDGAAVTRRLRERGSPVKVVFFTMHEGVHYALDALRAGAHGYVMKSRATGSLVEAIRTVNGNARYVSPPLDAQVDAILKSDGRKKRKVGLSAREMQVLRLLGQGLTLQEVARALGVGESTASTYRARLMGKLGLENSAQIIRFAVDAELMAQDEPEAPEADPGEDDEELGRGRDVAAS